MMSRSSCRVVSTLSRAALSGVTHIPNGGVFVYARLEILEDGRVDHA
jgi:hypothetical protein